MYTLNFRGETPGVFVITDKEAKVIANVNSKYPVSIEIKRIGLIFSSYDRWVMTKRNKELDGYMIDVESACDYVRENFPDVVVSEESAFYMNGVIKDYFSKGNFSKLTINENNVLILSSHWLVMFKKDNVSFGFPKEAIEDMKQKGIIMTEDDYYDKQSEKIKSLLDQEATQKQLN